MISFFSNIESQIAGDRSVVAVDSVQAVVMVVGTVVAGDMVTLSIQATGAFT